MKALVRLEDGDVTDHMIRRKRNLPDTELDDLVRSLGQEDAEKLSKLASLLRRVQGDALSKTGVYITITFHI